VAKAPSEKHLEDWICTNVDRCTYIDNDFLEDEEWYHHQFITRIAAQQPSFPAGIPDLIAIHQDEMWQPSLSIVELKKDVINTEALAQCLRYMRDLQIIFADCRYSTTHHPGKIPYLSRDMERYMTGIIPEVSGILIGHTIADNNIKIAAMASDISIYLYDYVEDDYRFRPSGSKFSVETYPGQQYEHLSGSPIGWAAKDVIEQIHDMDMKMCPEFAKRVNKINKEDHE